MGGAGAPGARARRSAHAHDRAPGGEADGTFDPARGLPNRAAPGASRRPSFDRARRAGTRPTLTVCGARAIVVHPGPRDRPSADPRTRDAQAMTNETPPPGDDEMPDPPDGRAVGPPAGRRTRGRRVRAAARALGAALAAAAPGAAAHAQARPPAAPAAPAPFRVEETTIAAVRAALRAGTLTCRDLVAAYLRRIEAYDRNGPAVNALVLVNPAALAAADSLDARRRAGAAPGPLDCVPVVVKDNFETAGLQTTAGSR